MGMAREPQCSRLASLDQPSGKSTFLSPPHCHPPGPQGSQKYILLPLVGSCASSRISQCGQGWGWPLAYLWIPRIAFAPPGPYKATWTIQRDSCAQNARGCWAGRSHGCCWLKGKVWRGRQGERAGAWRGDLRGWVGEVSRALGAQERGLSWALASPTPQDPFCEWHQSTNRKGDAACSRRGRGQGALKSPEECPPLCSQ